MISVDEALALVLENVAPLGRERVSILNLRDRVLAEEIRSPREIPAFDNSAMDGYAVRAADVSSAAAGHPVRLAVTETIAAGAMPSKTVGNGQAARIMTGAPIPEGADSIVPVERTRGEGDTVEILAAAEVAAFVRPRGEDLRRGEVVLSPGRKLTSADLGTLASLNRAMVYVYRRPRVAIIATGDELVDIDQIPSGAQVINSSAYGLFGAIEAAGGEPVMLGIAPDRADEIRARLKEASSFDMALSTGGVSVGQFDHVKGGLDQIGMRELFHGVAQRPGRPLKFGLIEGRPFFGLPGNPVSTMVCFYLYARAAIRKMNGITPDRLGLPRISVRCAVDIKKANNLTEFVRVMVERKDGELLVRPTGNQSSGALSSLSRADALLIGPAADNPLKTGSYLTALVLDPEGVTDTESWLEARHRRQSH
ncbi:MAG: molybdopterin molybdotransferase MoeA [Candidatus Binataceae bacterium]|nr:molybdopterin molybdotransferase MoeA [Candidatus Binataceae bacterium]